ncbi:complex I subunit 5 family protein [Microbacterium sp. AG238]|jgi:formate hydrogenlyase subunit 3/multisubunit Na+/H+ antiporter MnhD subunit|uniref:complex I subunit 5 family protein n=1 Tax=Microbacterium sp. AG238 TaxID=2183994 RepID=UPI000FF647E7|nr:complex I subunit 5 family protein [Microbacterium sp. AG238]RKE59315.1 formate hydrogenlyase subunit 3/multisubunit Na+/H+ antiporter MnhD subunit [Microbacterium sp. AG238]
MAVIFVPALSLPLLVAALIAVLSGVGGSGARRAREQLARFSWLAVVPAGAAAVVDAGARHEVAWMLLGTSIRLDAIARPLVLMAVVLYGVALSFVVRSKAERPHVLTAFLLLCFTGNIAVFLADDLVTFYLAFAAMSFLGYAIVVHDRTRGARRAGVIYLVLTVFGECAVLAALLMLAADGVTTVGEAPAAVAASPASGTIILLLLIGFGVKAGTVPLHVWLPLAHPAAPSPASAVLSGAMLKAGIVGWLRFLPLGEGGGEPVWGGVFLMLGLVGGLLAVPAGVLQRNPKVILAYSSISQMGFLTAVVGAALVAPEFAPACVAAVVVYSVSHGLVKGALFLGVQAWDSERLPRWSVTAGLTAASLALVGAPFTSGFVAKYVAKEAVGEVSVPLLPALGVADVLPWFGVGSTLLLARFAVALSRRERSPKRTARMRGLAWLALSVLAVVPVAALAASWAPPLSVPGWLDPSAVWAQTWPLLLGLVAAAIAWAVTRRTPERSPTMPPGDIVVIEERAARGVLRALTVASTGLGRVRGAVVARVAAGPSAGPVLDRAQHAIGTWPGAGALLALALGCAVLVAVLIGLVAS